MPMHERLRILQLANEAGPLNLFMMPVCDALRQAGCDVELACMSGGPLWEGLEKSGYTLHPLRRGRWKNPLYCWRIYRQVRSLLRRSRYDMMVVHTPVMSWIARFAARGVVGKVVYMAHGLPFAPMQGGIVYRIFRRVERAMARYTDAVIVMNKVDAEACRQNRLTKHGGKWFYVPGVGVDIEKWSTPPADSELVELDRKFNLAPGKPLVLFLGRFIPAKRPGDVLEVARRLGDRADYLLAGEGPLWETIRRQAEGIGPFVHVAEFTHMSRQLLHRCTVLALPSVFREGLPRVLLEAQAAGKPAVAYDVRGSQDVIESGRTGLLVPPGDVDAFCDAVEQILADQQVAHKMGQAGFMRVQKQFSLAASVREQLSALSAVLNVKNLQSPCD